MAAALDPALSGNLTEDGQEFAENYSKYLILGGGISGLSAASHMVQKGVKDFKLLEARNRLGGRVITMTIGNVFLLLSL